MHDSAVASESPSARAASSTCSSTGRVVLREDRRLERLAASPAPTRRPSPKSSIQISPSCAQIVAWTPAGSPPASESALATADSLSPYTRRIRCSGACARASTRCTASSSSAECQRRRSSGGGPGRTTATAPQPRRRGPAPSPRSRSTARLREPSPAFGLPPRIPHRAAGGARRSAARHARSPLQARARPTQAGRRRAPGARRSGRRASARALRRRRAGRPTGPREAQPPAPRARLRRA